MTSKIMSRTSTMRNLCMWRCFVMGGPECYDDATFDVILHTVTLGHETMRRRWQMCEEHANKAMEMARVLGVQGA